MTSAANRRTSRPAAAAARGAILADLTPVRPLPAPLRRALVLLPAGILLLAAQPLIYGLRDDAPVLGLFRLWGLSAAQSLLGLLFIAAALREAVPGRTLRAGACRVLLFALGALVSVAYVTFVSRGSGERDRRAARTRRALLDGVLHASGADRLSGDGHRARARLARVSAARAALASAPSPASARA